MINTTGMTGSRDRMPKSTYNYSKKGGMSYITHIHVCFSDNLTGITELTPSIMVHVHGL